MERKILVFVCLLVIALMVASTVPVGAKKPPKDPPDGGSDPTGTIYYTYHEDGTHNVYTMNADGSSKTKQNEWPGEYYSMSRSEHGGKWWFIGFDSVTGSYPDGQPRYEIFATSDDGQTSVQLTDDADMAYTRLSIPPTWGLSDDTVTWSAVIWGTDASGNDVETGAGIYQATVNWVDDAVTSIGTINEVVDCSAHNYGSTQYHPAAREGMDWSPDGTKLTYGRYDDMDKVIKVYIYAISSDVETELATGYNPKWSPDGALIAYGYARDLYIIKPDGTGETKLVTHDEKVKSMESIRHHLWAPDNKFLVYQSRKISYTKIGVQYTNIVVVDLDGDKDVLTGTLTSTEYKTTVGWR